MTEPNHYKLYRYFDSDGWPLGEVPFPVDYVKGLNIRLHPIHTWDKGRITETQWHASFNLDAQGEEVGSDLIVKETFVYTLDAVGLARHRLQTITWIREDESEGDTKTREKIYSNAASRTEGRRRRRNVMDNLSIAVVGLLAASEFSGDMAAAITEGKSYMAGIAFASSLYIEDGNAGLHNHIQTDTSKTWLNNVIAPDGTTVRDYILEELS